MKKSNMGVSIKKKNATPKASPKNAKNAKPTPVGVKAKKVSRTTIVKSIKATGGKFFSSTHVDGEGNLRTMNCRLAAGNPVTELGHIRVYVPKEKGFRMINPQTLKAFNGNGENLVAKA